MLPVDPSQLAKELPLKEAYEDLLQPAARVLGKNLETVAKLVTVAISPVAGAVWGFERIRDWLLVEVSDRLSKTPSGQIVAPSPLVAGPAIEALRFAASDETLREMYANLLATAMDSETASSAHPSFVEMLKQLSPDEARILKVFEDQEAFPLLQVRDIRGDGWSEALRYFGTIAVDAKCEHQHLFPSYVDNLTRLGLLEVPGDFWLVSEGVYDPLESHPEVVALLEHLRGEAEREQDSDPHGGVRESEMHRLTLQRTALGSQFIDACVRDRREAH